MSNYTISEISFPSADGKNTVRGVIYTPTSGTVRGVIQLVHGMIDHMGRYRHVAEYFISQGYAFAGNDHLGHGKTAASPDDFGYFADSDGVLMVLKDIHTMNKQLRVTFAGLPIILLGHSMGSFLSRLYVECHPHSISAHIIHGTGGPNPLLGLGKTLIKWKMLRRGGRFVSKTIINLAHAGYNSRFDKSEGETAWFTRETEMVSDRRTDPMTSFYFTLGGYADLFKMLGDSNSKKWFENYPKELPTIIMSGTDDPVGNFGKGPEYVYKQLMVQGVSDVSLKLYGGARHELFNETNRLEVFADMLSWIEGVVGK